jgi:hypothetical protein
MGMYQGCIGGEAAHKYMHTSTCTHTRTNIPLSHTLAPGTLAGVVNVIR